MKRLTRLLAKRRKTNNKPKPNRAKRQRSLRGRLRRYNIKQAEFDRRKAELSKRWKEEPSDTDVIWAVLNDHTVEIAKQSRQGNPAFVSMKMNARLKALVLYDEGKDPYDLLCEAAKWDLMAKQQNPAIVGVQVSVEKDACSTCRKLKGKEFSIDEALKKKPIPNKSCSFDHNGKRGWCRCWYAPVMMDSKEFVKQVRRQLWGK